MTAKFELVRDDLGRFSFRLLDGDRVLLGGLPNTGKIAVQGDVLHTRQAIAKGDAFVAHTGDDGHHFAVLKDKNGEVLARTIRLATSGELAVVIDRIAAIAGNAGMMDHSGTPHRLHA